MSDETDPAASPAEAEAARAKRRAERGRRKAHAEGFLAGICAMLRPGDLAIDGGANVGVVTARLAATGAEVWAFEPDPWCFAQLTARFAETPNVVLHNAALGASAGTVRLMRADNFDANPRGASVKSTILDGGRRIDAGTGIDVELVDFPALVADRAAAGGIAFVKLDIEGAELEILEELDRRDLMDGIRCLVAETHERKFKDLRPRFRALRRLVAEKYANGRVHLDWI